APLVERRRPVLVRARRMDHVMVVDVDDVGQVGLGGIADLHPTTVARAWFPTCFPARGSSGCTSLIRRPASRIMSSCSSTIDRQPHGAVRASFRGAGSSS